jgi:hypothetical protein
VLRDKLLPLWLLPLLIACSDQRAAFEIGSSQHSLTLIRVQTFFWDKTADYSIVAARMPDCMRRHEIGSGGAESKGRGLCTGQRRLDSQTGQTHVRRRDAQL